MLLHRAYYFVRSFLKKPASTSDYPVRVRKQQFEGAPPFVARIEGWPGLFGLGNDRDAAISDLNRVLQDFAMKNPLPRPGTKVPIRFASTERIDSLRDLRDDFIARVLNMNPSETFISDDSDLTEFPETLEEYNRKTILLYGIDVEALSDTRIATILEAIRRGPDSTPAVAG